MTPPAPPRPPRRPPLRAAPASRLAAVPRAIDPGAPGALRAAPGVVRPVAMVVYEDAQILDVTGPMEVFARTGRWLVEHGRAAEPAYRTQLLAKRAGPVRTSGGIVLHADRAWSELRPGAAGVDRIDTLLVSGGIGFEAPARDEALLAWLRATSPRVRRLGSVCTGSFVLAAAGLLDGRRATTHWAGCRALAERHRDVEVDPDPIFVRDGHLWTSAGVTAGMDMALAMVEEDHGHDVALGVARELVLFLKRPGGQSQFSAQLAAQAAEREPLRELQAWMAEHPEADLSVPALARRVAMSPRHFTRVFTQSVGVSPARFATRVRVEAARRWLEETADGVEAIAGRCGFGSAELMRRAFLRLLRVSPAAYRTRFRATRAA